MTNSTRDLILRVPAISATCKSRYHSINKLLGGDWCSDISPPASAATWPRALSSGKHFVDTRLRSVPTVNSSLRPHLSFASPFFSLILRSFRSHTFRHATPIARPPFSGPLKCRTRASLGPAPRSLSVESSGGNDRFRTTSIARVGDANPILLRGWIPVDKLRTMFQCFSEHRSSRQKNCLVNDILVLHPRMRHEC
jgi:hypothetical protein